jgi:hypothetical protein
MLVNTQGSLSKQLTALGSFHMRSSIKEASWETYATPIRHWVRFRIGVQRRHPCQIVSYDRKGVPQLEDDAEESLIQFVEWISLAGTVSPSTASEYVSGVKAAHLLWKGYPYAAITETRFYRLGRVLSGLRKTTTLRKQEPREGLVHAHFVDIFDLHDRLFANKPAPLLLRGEQFAEESVMISLWQAILRPDEVISTSRHPHHAMCDWVNFRNARRQIVPYSTPYSEITCVELTLYDGRKNDTAKQNPPIILAADHDFNSCRFSACFQMHRALNYMAPDVAILGLVPLFPVKLVANIGTNTRHSMRSFSDIALTQCIRTKLAITLHTARGVSAVVLKAYTGYSLRIGGAISLHDAGADGMVIAALGQWRSDVYQLYIRTARHKAMAWTVRMSRGYKAII